MDFNVLLIGLLKSVCYTECNKIWSTLYMYTTIHETSFLLVSNILRPQFSNDCKMCYFWHIKILWHKQKPNRYCFIIYTHTDRAKMFHVSELHAIITPNQHWKYRKCISFIVSTSHFRFSFGISWVYLIYYYAL